METTSKRGTTLTVRGLDVAIIERLKARAHGKGRSLEAELREVLTHTSRQPLVLDPLEEADRIAAMTPPPARRTGGGQ